MSDIHLDREPDRTGLELLQLQPVGPLGREAQLALIAILYVITIGGYLVQLRTTGKIAGYPPSASLLFAPIYEEVIFRGILLGFFVRHYGSARAILLTSASFGLWHLKNAFWLPPAELGSQIGYCFLIFSPTTCLVTLRARSIWPSVILHYLNNLPVW